MIPMPAPNPDILAQRDEILSALATILPASAIVDSVEERRAFECDALAAYRQLPLAAVLPETTEQVAAIVKVCKKFGVPIIPRGSGTSLSGGALPTQDAIVLGVSKMSDILEVDFPNRTIRVQTGVTNIGVTQAVEHNRFFYAPDPSSQLACAIAGNIGMNSGGAHCLKYGVTTNNLLGVTLVTPDGEIVEIGGPYMDPQGLDLLGLICGSEGQLGIVTEATLRILPMPEGARPMLMGFDSAEEAGACVAAIIRSGLIPVALEYMDRPAIKVCEEYAQAGYPLDVEAMLIIEVEGNDEEIYGQLDQIQKIAEPFNPRAIRVAEDDLSAALIWKGRKAAFGAIGQIADYICMDGTIPTGELPFVLKRIGEISTEYGLNVANIFHAGDGNLHPLVMYNANDPIEFEKAEKMGEDILQLCVEVGGCLTGEHGVGIEKRDLMVHQFTPTDLAQQKAVKDALDPAWLFNPAKVFPLTETDGSPQ